MQPQSLKSKILTHLHLLLNQKIATAEQAIQSAIESRDNESKSSVGDKYETGRAMMHIEQQKNEVQLSKAITLKNVLSQINIEKKSEQAELGSLVKTDNGIFFLSIGLGKIEMDDKNIFAISLASPIGKLLFGKKVGDQIQFQNKANAIVSIA